MAIHKKRSGAVTRFNKDRLFYEAICTNQTEQEKRENSILILKGDAN